MFIQLCNRITHLEVLDDVLCKHTQIRTCIAQQKQNRKDEESPIVEADCQPILAVILCVILCVNQQRNN